MILKGLTIASSCLLIDYKYSGDGFGLYSATSVISLKHSVVKVLPNPEEKYAGQEEAQKIE